MTLEVQPVLLSFYGKKLKEQETNSEGYLGLTMTIARKGDDASVPWEFQLKPATDGKQLRMDAIALRIRTEAWVMQAKDKGFDRLIRKVNDEPMVMVFAVEPGFHLDFDSAVHLQQEKHHVLPMSQTLHTGMPLLRSWNSGPNFQPKHRPIRSLSVG
jgi:hypothetical protein